MSCDVLWNGWTGLVPIHGSNHSGVNFLQKVNVCALFLKGKEAAQKVNVTLVSGTRTVCLSRKPVTGLLVTPQPT